MLSGSFFVSQRPPGVPLPLSGASVPIDQSVRNWLESVRNSWSTSEWVSALGGLSTGWWKSYRVSRLMLACSVQCHVYTLLTFKRHPSRVLILGNISAFHFDPSTVASSVHRWVTASVHYGLGHLSVSRRRPLLLAIVPSSPQSGGIFTYLVSISVTLMYIALQYRMWCPPALHNFTLLCN